MRWRRASLILAALVATLGITNGFSSPIERIHFSTSYPAAVCPPSDTSVVSQTSLASSSTQFRRISGKSTSLHPIKTLRYKSDGSAILLDQSSVSSLTWQGLSGVWAGATICRAPQSDQWFVGGSANVLSKGRIYLVNSGLSAALVDVGIWNQKGALPGKVYPLKANSTLKVALDSLAAGSDRLVLRVTPRSGRVNAFLIEERSQGLKKLGGDIVNPTDSPQTDFVISGIPHQRKGGKGEAHVIRFLVPGSIGAHVRVDLISTDGVFAPVGLDGVDLAPGKAVDIVLNPTIASTIFSLRVRSDQPIVAGVFSSLVVNGHTEVVWNAPSPLLVPITLAVRGTTPTLVFTGESISVAISTHMSSGKIKSTRVSGADIAAWKVPDGATAVDLASRGRPIFASGIVSSTSGMAAFPILPGSEITRAAIPSADISVINR